MDKKNKISPFQEVPVEKAALIGEVHSKDQVVIITVNRSINSVTVTTWGKTVHDADQAAESGNVLKEAIGWPASKCNAISAKVQVLLDALTIAKLDLISRSAENTETFKKVQNALKLGGAK